MFVSRRHRNLKTEERATEALYSDPLTELSQTNRFAVKREGVPGRDFAPIPNGRSQALHQIVVTGPFRRRNRFQITRQNNRVIIFSEGAGSETEQ